MQILKDTDTNLLPSEITTSSWVEEPTLVPKAALRPFSNSRPNRLDLVIINMDARTQENEICRYIYLCTENLGSDHSTFLDAGVSPGGSRLKPFY